MPTWCIWLVVLALAAANLARFNPIMESAARVMMITMTTSSSVSEKPSAALREREDHRLMKSGFVFVIRSGCWVLDVARAGENPLASNGVKLGFPVAGRNQKIKRLIKIS